MVVGLERWRAHFADYADRYVLVGGVACDRLMEDAGLAFRATKDLDVVLFVELLDASFARAFWDFISAGGYQMRARADGGQLYRFAKPQAHDYPHMIELFSRAPEGFELARLPRDCTLQLQGLPLLSEAGLIPFKAKAYLDLAARKAAGDAVDGRDVRKHRSDVFRLLQLLPAQSARQLPDQIRADMAAFLEAVRGDETFKPGDLGLKMSSMDALARLAEAFGL
jgi:hypothetical protein